MQVLSIFVFIMLGSASFAPWSAWSQAVNQAIKPEQVTLQPAGRDTVSLEIRKRLLADREAELLARREAAMAARKTQN
jgi:hypothetical protein